MPKLEEIQAIYVGSSSVDRIMLNGEQVWPTSVSYVIVRNTIALRYSSGVMIAASGANYAYVTATVQTIRGGVVIDTFPDVHLTINSVSSGFFTSVDGKEIHGSNLGTTPSSQLNGFVTSYQYDENTVINDNPLPVTQHANASRLDYNEDVYQDDYALSAYDIDYDRTIFTIGGEVTVERTPHYIWDSRVPSVGKTTYVTLYPAPTITAVSSEPYVMGVTFDENVVYTSINLGYDDIVYTITAEYTSPNGDYYGPLTIDVTQYQPATTYDRPESIFLDYTDVLLACEDSVIPSTLEFVQQWHRAEDSGYIYSVSYDPYTATGIMSDGSTFNASFTGSPIVNGASISTGGVVTAPSRGTVVGNERAVVILIDAVVQSHGKRNMSNVDAQVMQKANGVERTIPARTEYYGASVDRLTAQNIDIDCGDVTVYAYVTATYSEFTTETQYTSYDDGDTDGGYTGGVETAYVDRPISEGDANLSLLVDSGSGYDDLGSVLSFVANNEHSTDQKTYYVKASYGGVEGSPNTITQAADSVSYGVLIPGTYGASLSYSDGQTPIWAGGGTATLEPSAYHDVHDVWSDGTEVSGSRETVYTDTPVIYVYSGGTGFTLTGMLVEHRDMVHDETTDTVSYRAYNASSPGAESSSVTFSVQNTETVTPGEMQYGPKVYDYQNQYTDYSDWAFSCWLEGLAFSTLYPAPSDGGSARLLITAHHSEQEMTPWSMTRYMDVYHEWTSLHNETVRVPFPDTTGADATGALTTVSDISRVSVLSIENPSMVSIGGISSSGDADGEATLTVQPNSGAARTSNFVLRRAAYGDQSYSDYLEVVSQKAYVELSASPMLVDLAGEGDSAVITVTALNTSWSLSLSDSPIFNGATVVPADGSSYNTGTTISLTVGATIRERIGTITITSDVDPSKSADITVRQFEPPRPPD